MWEGDKGRKVGNCKEQPHGVCHLLTSENFHPQLAREAKVIENQNLIRAQLYCSAVMSRGEIGI